MVISLIPLLPVVLAARDFRWLWIGFGFASWTWSFLGGQKRRQRCGLVCGRLPDRQNAFAALILPCTSLRSH